MNIDWFINNNLGLTWLHNYITNWHNLFYWWTVYWLIWYARSALSREYMYLEHSSSVTLRVPASSISIMMPWPTSSSYPRLRHMVAKLMGNRQHYHWGRQSCVCGGCIWGKKILMMSFLSYQNGWGVKFYHHFMRSSMVVKRKI